MSESVPTGVSSFAHRRSRADSTASFTYFQTDEDEEEWPENDVLIDDDEFDGDLDDVGDSVDIDLESGRPSPSVRRKSSAYSRASVEEALLHRHDSARTDGSHHIDGGRVSQKIYILTEDLTIVIAGFSTSHIGSLIYAILCLATLGIGYLLLRWLPRWRVRLVGSPKPLRECTWVVIEVRLKLDRKTSKQRAKAGQNQWGEFSVHGVQTKPYGQSLSTVFGTQEKRPLRRWDDEDDDPVMPSLRFLDYRYIRFCYHPYRDQFVLNNNWKDPAWSDVKAIRSGLDGDEKDSRELVFGKNLIDIEVKSTAQLLVDEVRSLVPNENACPNSVRHSTHSTFSKLPVSCCGHWTNTTIMLLAFF